MTPSNLKRFVVVAMLFFAVTACAPSQWKKEQSESHINLGIAYLGSERFTEALKELLQAEEFTPRDPQVHYYLGIAYNGKDMTDKAVNEFMQAVSLNPEYSEAYNFLGMIYLRQGQWDRAIDAFKKALGNMLYVTPDKALFNMGRAYYGKGDYPAALTQYAEAKRKGPNTIPPALLDHHIGMAVYAQGDYHQASQYFIMAIEQTPAFHEARLWLGNCYLKMHDRVRAREAFQAIIKEAAPQSDLIKEAKKGLDAI